MGDIELAELGEPLRRQASISTDNYFFVFWVLLINGVGTLMPWNMFINAKEYFTDFKLANQTEFSDVNYIQYAQEVALLNRNFMYYLGIASQIPSFLFNGLNLLVNFGEGNLILRVNLSLALEASIFILTIILASIDTRLWQKTFFYLTMGCVVILNMANGVYQNCIFGTGAKFPGSYTNAIVLGSNLSGTLTSLTQILALAFSPGVQLAAIIYFFSALFVIGICLVSYNLLPKSDFYNYFDSQTQKVKPEDVPSSERATYELTSQSDSQSEESPKVQTQPESVEINQSESAFMKELRRKKFVLSKCWPQCLNVFLTFFVTLALFPTVISEVKQSQGLFNDIMFIPIICFLIFNFFALLGSSLTHFVTWPGRHRLWIFVLLRFAFIPFFLLSNINTKRRVWPVYIENDIIFGIGNALFALTSGYASSLAVMFNGKYTRPDEAQIGGMLIGFFLVFGIFVGINSSILFLRIVEYTL